MKRERNREPTRRDLAPTLDQPAPGFLAVRRRAGHLARRLSSARLALVADRAVGTLFVIVSAPSLAFRARAIPLLPPITTHNRSHRRFRTRHGQAVPQFEVSLSSPLTRLKSVLTLNTSCSSSAVNRIAARAAGEKVVTSTKRSHLRHRRLECRLHPLNPLIVIHRRANAC